VITLEEIGEVAVFSSFGPAEREQLSRAAADLSLLAGEFAALEGDEQAIFAVLEGRIEAVKATDGIERVVGERVVIAFVHQYLRELEPADDKAPAPN
jgi:thioredoxin reductase (NADPH)